MANPEQLKDEIVELTEMLRSERVLEDLRRLLCEKNVEPASAFLAGFLENADGFEAGVIVTRGGEIFEFERVNIRTSAGFDKWQRVTDTYEVCKKYPAIGVAVEIARGQ